MKELIDMTFDDLVDYIWGEIVLAIGASGKGEGLSPRSVLWHAMRYALDWREQQEKKSELGGG